MPVNLSKGQTVNLDKPGLRRIRVALGWDPAKSGRSIDLDASLLGYRGFDHVFTVYYGDQRCAQGVAHSGDNLTGDGEGDDEYIDVALPDILAREGTDSLAVTINSFSGQTFGEVGNAYCRLVDLDTDEELVRYELSALNTLTPAEIVDRKQTGLVMAVIQNVDGRWEMTALGTFLGGRTGRDMVGPVGQILRGEDPTSTPRRGLFGRRG